MSDSKALTIGTTSVRQVGELYSLNDLHKASGGEVKHQPGYFMRRDETKDLVAELEGSPEMVNSGNSANSQSYQTKEGRGGGTYACKELVIAYAAWISAAFHLKVIRVFLSVTAPQAQEQHPTMSLTDCSEREKVGKFLVAMRKRAVQHLELIDKQMVAWEIVDKENGKAMPSQQAMEISTRLERLGKLFHPFSDQFVDVLGLSRALRGLDPKMAARNAGWVEVLPKITA